MSTSSSSPFPDDTAQPVVVEAEEAPRRRLRSCRRPSARCPRRRRARLPRSTVSGTIVATSSSIREPGGACAGSATTSPLSLAIWTMRFLWCTRISASKRSRSAGSLTANVTRLLVPVRGRKIDPVCCIEIDGREERHRQLLHVGHRAELLVEGPPADGCDGALLVRPDRDGDLVDGVRRGTRSVSGCSGSAASATQTRIQRGPAAAGASGSEPPFASASSRSAAWRRSAAAGSRLPLRRAPARPSAARWGLPSRGAAPPSSMSSMQLGRRRELGSLRLVAGRRQRRLARSRPSSRRPPMKRATVCGSLAIS